MRQDKAVFLRLSFRFVFADWISLPENQVQNSYSRTRRGALRDCSGNLLSGYELDVIKCTPDLAIEFPKKSSIRVSITLSTTGTAQTHRPGRLPADFDGEMLI